MVSVKSFTLWMSRVELSTESLYSKQTWGSNAKRETDFEISKRNTYREDYCHEAD